MRVSKYQPLTDSLINNNDVFCRLTFDEIEQLIGDRLPESAYSHASVLWNDANGHYARHWLKAERVVVQYDISKRFAVFKKDIALAHHHLAKTTQDTGTQRIRQANAFSPKSNLTISCEEVISASRKYINEVFCDEHARYLFWEHCYGFFQKHRMNPDEEQLDLTCLHLAWYLASWGMLRGSAFLLQKDYRVHMPIVKLLISEQYRDLNNCPVEKLTDPHILAQIMTLSDEIVELYRGLTEDLGNGEGKVASDTLITKILLGTLGCVPAYDRYFKSGLSLSKVAQQSYGVKSMGRLAEYYLDNYDQFETFRRDISQGRVEYTPMKIIDMCFWQIGFDHDSSDKSDAVGD